MSIGGGVSGAYAGLVKSPAECLAFGTSTSLRGEDEVCDNAVNEECLRKRDVSTYTMLARFSVESKIELLNGDVRIQYGMVPG